MAEITSIRPDAKSAVAAQPKIEAKAETEAKAAAEVKETNANVTVADKAEAEIAKFGQENPAVVREVLKILAHKLTPNAVEEARQLLQKDKEAKKIKSREAGQEAERIKTVEKQVETRLKEAERRIKTLKESKNPVSRALGYDFTIHELKINAGVYEQRIKDLTAARDKAPEAEKTKYNSEIESQRTALRKSRTELTENENKRKEIKTGEGKDIPDTVQAAAHALNGEKLQDGVDPLQYLSDRALNALVYSDQNIALNKDLVDKGFIKLKEQQKDYQQTFSLVPENKHTVMRLAKKGSLGAGGLLLLFMYLGKKKNEGQQGMAA